MCTVKKRVNVFTGKDILHVAGFGNRMVVVSAVVSVEVGVSLVVYQFFY